MKKTLFSLLLLAAAFFANAESFKGGEIWIGWSTDTTYNILLYTYLPCTGPTAPIPDSIYVCYHNSCNTTTGTLTLHLDPTSSLPAPLTHTYAYTTDFALPSACDHWTFYTSLAGRDSSVNVNSAGSNVYLEATLNNTVYHPFATLITYMPMYDPYLPINVPYSISTSPTVDSNVFETIMPRTAPANYLNPALCQGGYVATDLTFTDTMYNLVNNPIACNNSYTINQMVGTTTRNFTPAAAGLGKNILAFKVNHYKNGVFVASSMIDQEFTIVADTVHINNYLDTTSISGGYFNGNMIEVEAGATVEFCVITVSNDTAVTVMDNHGVSLSGSSASYSTSNDTTRACFTWTPSAIDTGIHNLFLVTHYPVDSTLCGYHPIFDGSSQLFVPVNVVSPSSVNNLSNNNAVKIFPNPVQQTVYVQAATPVQLMVMGLDGRTVLQRNHANSIDISELPDGLYLLRIADQNGVFIKMEKLIKTAVR